MVLYQTINSDMMIGQCTGSVTMNCQAFIVTIRANRDIRSDGMAPDLQIFPKHGFCRLIRSFAAFKQTGLVVAVLLGCLLMAETAKAQVQPPSAPDVTIAQDPAGDETDEEETDYSNDVIAAGVLKRRSLSAQSTETVGSSEWSKAPFTGFIDIRQRLDQPDQKLLEAGLRLLTTDDFPPFNSRGPDGLPIGYHVELARSLCEELNIACTLKIVSFADIPAMMEKGEADAALAGLVNSPDLKEIMGFSNVYLQRPARFVCLKEKSVGVGARALDGQPVAVRGGTAHEAFLKAYFPNINRVPINDLEDARRLLMDEKVMAIFGDAFQLLPMIAASESSVRFEGKPYYDARFFGDGMAVAYSRKQNGLENLINYGLLRLAQKGRLAELYARHFALDIYENYESVSGPDSGLSIPEGQQQ